MNPVFLMLLTFGAVVTAVGGVYSIVSDLYLRDRSRFGQRIDDEFRRRQRDRVKRSQVFHDLDALIPGPEVQRPSLRRRLEIMIEQAAVEVTPERLGAIALVAAVGLGTVLGLARQSVILGAASAVVGLILPFAYVEVQRRSRMGKMLAQLPDAFDLMGRVVRAGQTTSQALQAVSDEFAQPIAGEFSYCFEQQNLGLSPELALRDLARRTGLLEIKIFVTALLVQQQTGGNLAELLDKLAHMIRQRAKLRGQIQTLTAEGRFQAMILLGLPIMLFFIMLVINHQYTSELLEHPTLIAAVLGLESIGAVWIYKIVNFDF